MMSPEANPPRLSLLAGLELMVFSQLCAIALILPVAIYAVATKAGRSWWGLGAAAMAGTAIGLIHWAKVTLRNWGIPWSALFAARRPVLPDLPWVTSAVVGNLLVVLPLSAFLAHRWKAYGAALADVKLPEGPLWITAPFIVLIAPVTEEILFRGVILRGLLGRYSTWTAIVGSAAIFALPHVHLVKLPTAFVIGCGLGWLYVRSGSMLLPIAAHMLNNGIAVVAGLLSKEPPVLPLWQTALLVTSGALLLACAYRGLKSEPCEMPLACGAGA